MSGRIRTIKPEWLDDEKLALSSPEARVLSVALILLADDHGNGRAAIPLLAGRVFPGKDLAVTEKALSELLGWFVNTYEVSGQSYYHLRNWSKHQRIRFRGDPRVPIEQMSFDLLTQNKNPQDLDLDQDLERDQDQDLLSSSGSDVGEKPTTESEMDTIRRVFVFWKKIHKHNQAKLDKKRTERIRARLREGFTGEQLADAIRGSLKDDFLMGRDKNANRKYDGIETILKSAAQVERLIELNSSKKNLAGKLVVESKEEAEEKVRKHAEAMQRKIERDRKETEKFIASATNQTENVQSLLKNILI